MAGDNEKLSPHPVVDQKWIFDAAKVDARQYGSMRTRLVTYSNSAVACFSLTLSSHLVSFSGFYSFSHLS